MFATASGNVRRNALSDFVNVKANGKIAMKLDEGDRIVRVRTCTEDDDIILFARDGKCIRFSTTDVRVFKGRDSVGVRGMKLAKGDEVIGLSVLAHVDVETAERTAYLKYARALRGHADEEEGEDEDDASAAPTTISMERAEELAAQEQFVLSVTENGYGKRTSSYEYRVAGRGGQGIINIETGARNGKMVGGFPVEDSDEVMLVTDGGQLIRFPVYDIRIAGRGTAGVRLIRTSADERVVSVSRLRDVTDGGEEDDDDDGSAGPDAGATDETQ